MGGLFCGWFSCFGGSCVWRGVDGRGADGFLVRVILLSPNSLAGCVHSRSLIAVVC